MEDAAASEQVRSQPIQMSVSRLFLGPAPTEGQTLVGLACASKKGRARFWGYFKPCRALHPRPKVVQKR